MLQDKQNSIIKNPIPILVGNISLTPSSVFEYNYTSVYIVDVPYNTEQDFLVFDQIQNNWTLVLGYLTPYGNNFRSNYFPQLISTEGTYSMNGFVNNDAGYPEFYSEIDGITFHYNQDLSSWCYGYRSRSVSGELLTQYAIDTTDCRTGDYRVAHQISAFIPDKKEIGTPIYTNYKLFEGDPTIPSSILKFRNNDGDIITGKIIIHSNSILKSEDSPTIISGDPCLGYYYLNNNERPYIIGSICIGTEDLNTVPPIIGQNIDLIPSINYDGHKYYFDSEYGSNCPDIFPGSVSGIWDETAYLWVGKTFDENKDQWNLYQIKSFKWGELAPQYLHNTYILLSGGFPNINPCTAEQLWYMQSTETELFTYSALSGGLTFRGYPNGNDLHLKIVGLTNFNADELKHQSLADQIKMSTYIGNWLAPQATWRNE